jgi:hypothetical protein
LHDKATQSGSDNFQQERWEKNKSNAPLVKNELKFFMSNWFMDFEGNFNHAIIVGRAAIRGLNSPKAGEL